MQNPCEFVLTFPCEEFTSVFIVLGLLVNYDQYGTS